MPASTVPHPAARTATPTKSPLRSRTGRPPARAAAPAGATPAPRPLPGPDDYGRRLGAEFRADPRNAGRVRALVQARTLGLGGYDPDDRFGVGYRVFCGLTGEPDDRDRCYSYPLDRVPAEVVDFWEGIIIDARSPVEAMMFANHPDFAAAFVDAVTA